MDLLLMAPVQTELKPGQYGDVNSVFGLTRKVKLQFVPAMLNRACSPEEHCLLTV